MHTVPATFYLTYKMCSNAAVLMDLKCISHPSFQFHFQRNTYEACNFNLVEMLCCQAPGMSRFYLFLTSTSVYFSVSQPPDKILRGVNYVTHFDVRASIMDPLYLQDAVTQIRSHMPPEGITAPAQVLLKTPLHGKKILYLDIL